MTKFNPPSRNSPSVKMRMLSQKWRSLAFGGNSGANSSSVRFSLHRNEKKESICVSPWSFNKILTGKKAEKLAEVFLRKQGYKIIEKNYRTKCGEIDIIGKDKDCTSFIEVRSSSTEFFGLPQDSINRKKQNQISKAALSYIKRYGLGDKNCRFDVVCIEDINSLCPKVHLIKNAFDLDTRYRY